MFPAADGGTKVDHAGRIGAAPFAIGLERLETRWLTSHRAPAPRESRSLSARVQDPEPAPLSGPSPGRRLPAIAARA